MKILSCSSLSLAINSLRSYVKFYDKSIPIQMHDVAERRYLLYSFLSLLMNSSDQSFNEKSYDIV